MRSYIAAFWQQVRSTVGEVNAQFPLADAIVALISIAVGIYLNWPIVTAVLFGAFAWVMLRPVAGELLAKGSLLGILGVVVLLLAGRGERAETLAALSYYLLAITVVVILRERRQDEA